MLASCIIIKTFSRHSVEVRPFAVVQHLVLLVLTGFQLTMCF